MEQVVYSKGLEGVIAASSAICQIDGNGGKLFYRGYTVSDLAEHSSFEEVVFLLLEERLPTKAELEAFQTRVRGSRALKPEIREAIRNFPSTGRPMELLQSIVAYLSGYVDHKIEHSAHCDCRVTLHQVVQMASVVATYERFKRGLPYVEPDLSLSHGGNFLYMMGGQKPEPYEARIMDVCMLLHAEHGFNASTFTARVVASTLATCYSSISAAVGALSGSLHGGANESVLKQIDEIGGVDNVDRWLRNAVENGRKIMGFGHRVYKVKDPRAIVIEKFLKELSEKKNDSNAYAILKRLETLASESLSNTEKRVYPNVDFYSGSVFSLLGIPPYLFTPIFAASRIAGWLAHVLEQRRDNRLYRPKSLYRGPDPRPYVLIEDRDRDHNRRSNSGPNP